MTAVSTMGPYATERDTASEPWPAEDRRIHDEWYRAHPNGDSSAAGALTVGAVSRAAGLRFLVDACTAAGVELGDYDRQTLAWLAGWETATVQVIAGIISRAAAP